MKEIVVNVVRGDTQWIAVCDNPTLVTEASTLNILVRRVREAVLLTMEDENPVALGFSENPEIVMHIKCGTLEDL